MVINTPMCWNSEKLTGGTDKLIIIMQHAEMYIMIAMSIFHLKLEVTKICELDGIYG